MAERFRLCLALLALLVFPLHASAYPWMIRHEYAACGQCHADPSGGGILTAYGRAQGELLLRTHYTSADEDDPGKTAMFVFGAIPLPESLLLEGVSRSATLHVAPKGSPATNRTIQMQSDLRGELTVAKKIRFAGDIAYADSGVLQAAITTRPKANIVSREHW